MATFIWRNEFGPDRTKALTIQKADGTLPVHRRRTVVFTDRPSDHRLHYKTDDPAVISLITLTEVYLRDRIYWEDFHSLAGSATARHWADSPPPEGSVALVAAKLPFLPMSGDPDSEYDTFHDPVAPVEKEG